VAAITTNISYWNFFGFPGNYTVAAVVFQILAFFLLGLVVAGVVKSSGETPKPASSAASAA
jgi:hypothetical protein